ncbi:MAG: GAF domain-containing protein, partial [Verrucomicrobiota bacterium]|nr:GAF domain-containing protein [Verrucomicrobiota bacterium]
MAHALTMKPKLLDHPPADVGRLAQVERLYELTRHLHGTLEPRAALHQLVQEAVAMLGASSGSLALRNPTTGLLEIEASEGLPAEGAALKLRLDEGITGWVVREGRPVRVADVSSDDRYVIARTGIRAEMAVPLLLEGEIRGVLNVDAETHDAFSAADQALLEELAGHAT